MRTATELLHEQPPVPLSATLDARPLRLLTLVPEFGPYSWLRLFEYALAAQGRAWGGAGNVVMPFSQPLRESELFWRIADVFDPDGIGVFVPRWGDLEVLDPDAYAAERASWVESFADSEAEGLVEQVRDNFMYGAPELGDEFKEQLDRRLAPLHLEGDPELFYIDGLGPLQYPTTDVVAFRNLPSTISNVTTSLGEVEQLMVTARLGHLLPSFASALAERGVQINDVRAGNEVEWLDLVLPRRPAPQLFPASLSNMGLASRLSPGLHDQAVLVVGEEIWDFCLYQALSQLLPAVLWWPSTYLESALFTSSIAGALSSWRGMGIGWRSSPLSATPIASLRDPRLPAHLRFAEFDSRSLTGAR
jgi:hypothetical protein